MQRFTTEESVFKEKLPQHARKILAPKRLLLWKESLQELNYPDLGVFDEMVGGTHLVGEIPQCGMFEKKFKSADLAVEQLRSMSKADKHKEFYRCASSGTTKLTGRFMRRLWKKQNWVWP